MSIDYDPRERIAPTKGVVFKDYDPNGDATVGNDFEPPENLDPPEKKAMRAKKRKDAMDPETEEKIAKTRKAKAKKAAKEIPPDMADDVAKEPTIKLGE